MSRRGNCFDKAPIESFWGTLKNELVHHRRFTTRKQAKQEIAEYILTCFTIASGGRHGLVTCRRQHSCTDAFEEAVHNSVLAYTNSD